MHGCMTEYVVCNHPRADCRIAVPVGSNLDLLDSDDETHVEPAEPVEAAPRIVLGREQRRFPCEIRSATEYTWNTKKRGAAVDEVCGTFCNGFLTRTLVITHIYMYTLFLY